jgi:hypothetical protein
MKKQTLRIFTMFSFFIVLAVVSVRAQSSSLAKARIPFPFIIGSKLLAPGEYRIELVSPSSDQCTLLIRSEDGHTRALVRTTQVVGRLIQTHGTLVFTRYGNEYFLSQVWPGTDTIGLALPKSHRERGFAREVAQSSIRRQQIEVIARAN